MKRSCPSSRPTRPARRSSRSHGHRPRPLVHRARGEGVRLHRPRRRPALPTSPAAAAPTRPRPERRRPGTQQNQEPEMTRPASATARRPAATCSRSSRSARRTASSGRTRTRKLFEDRMIFLGVQVDDASADDVMAQLLVLESQDPDRDITHVHQLPGGSFTALTAIYDTMQYIRPDIQTVCLGQAASAAAVLLAAGAPGKRLALPNARVLIHQPAMAGGDYGQASDIEIQANEVLRMRTWLEEHAGLPLRPHRRAGQDRHRARQDPHRRPGDGLRPGRPGARRAARPAPSPRAETAAPRRAGPPGGRRGGAAAVPGRRLRSSTADRASVSGVHGSARRRTRAGPDARRLHTWHGSATGQTC